MSDNFRRSKTKAFYSPGTYFAAECQATKSARSTMHVRFFAIYYISLPIVCKSNEKLKVFCRASIWEYALILPKLLKVQSDNPIEANFFLILICVILAGLNLKIAEGGFHKNFLVRYDVTVKFKVTRHVSVVFKHLFLSKIALQLKRQLFYQNA